MTSQSFSNNQVIPKTKLEKQLDLDSIPNFAQSVINTSNEIEKENEEFILSGPGDDNSIFNKYNNKINMSNSNMQDEI